MVGPFVVAVGSGLLFLFFLSFCCASDCVAPISISKQSPSATTTRRAHQFIWRIRSSVRNSSFREIDITRARISRGFARPVFRYTAISSENNETLMQSQRPQLMVLCRADQ